MSAIVLISSGSPPEADVAAVGRDSPELTLSGHERHGRISTLVVEHFDPFAGACRDVIDVEGVHSPAVEMEADG